MKLRILDRIGVLFDSRFWVRSEPVSHPWSDKIDSLLERGEPIYKRSMRTVEIGDEIIWVSNMMYAYGSRFAPQTIVWNNVPRRRTALHLHRAVEEALDNAHPRPVAYTFPASLLGGSGADNHPKPAGKAKAAA